MGPSLAILHLCGAAAGGRMKQGAIMFRGWWGILWGFGVESRHSSLARSSGLRVNEKGCDCFHAA